MDVQVTFIAVLLAKIDLQVVLQYRLLFPIEIGTLSCCFNVKQYLLWLFLVLLLYF